VDQGQGLTRFFGRAKGDLGQWVCFGAQSRSSAVLASAGTVPGLVGHLGSLAALGFCNYRANIKD